MKRTFRAFIGREHANGWRPTEEELVVLRPLPMYEAYSLTKGTDTDVVDLLDKRWIPPQGAARELMDTRCLKLVQAEDASLYECLQISMASESLFFSEFVFPLRLQQLDEPQQDSTMLGVLRSLPRLQQADPQFKSTLSDVAFITTASGVRRCPTDVYHPDLKEIVAELLGADEHLPTGAFAEPDILAACGELGLRRSVDRTTLLESAKSVASLPPADGLHRAKTLLSYLDGNFQALVKNSVGAEAFQSELLQLCWLPAQLKPSTACLPWSSEPMINVARPSDIRPQRDAWLVSSSMRLLDHKIQSADLEEFLGLSKPIPIGVLTEQIIQLSEMSRKMESGWGTDMVAEFCEHMSVWRDVLYDALTDFMFNDSMDQQAQFEAAAAKLSGVPWFWTGSEWETPRFLSSFEMAFSGTLNDAELTDSTELAPYLYVIAGDSNDYEDLFQRLGAQLSFEAPDYMAVLERMESKYRGQPLPDAEMQLAVKLVSELGDRVTEIVQGVVLIPDNSKVLLPASQLLFNDASWLSLDGRDDLKVAHPDVSSSAAEKLGARSLRHMLAADSSISTSAVACPTAADVKAALETAEGCPSVLLDLLEVADMCGCTAVSFALDLRQYRSVSLLQPTLAQFQGPSLCFFMPETVLSRYEIGELMRAHGAGFRGTACRFGSGLVRGYELGEVMFVISGERFSVFDPSGAFLLEDLNDDDTDHQVGASGKEYDYVASGLPRRFPDQFRPFGHYGFSGEQPLPGTVIRIPLRTPNQAARSSIHSKVYSKDENVTNFAPVAKDFYQSACDTSLLLFAQHLSSVRFSTIGKEAGQSREPEPEPGSEKEATVAVESDGEPFELPEFFELSLVSPLAADRWAVLQEDWRPGFGSRFSKMFAGWKPPKQKLHLAFQFKNEHESHTDNWVVCSTLAAGDSRELAVDPQFRHFAALTPLGSVALHLARDGQTALPVDGQDFCCFPVGRETGLPVHVNGMFVLPRDSKLYHTNPTTDVNQRVQADWNTCVMANVVESYCDALLEVQTSCIQENPGRLYKYWPQLDPKGNVKQLVADPLFRLMIDSSVFLTEEGKFDRLENGFIATEQVKPSVSKFVSENFQVFDLPQGISDALLELQKTEPAGGPLDVLRKFGPGDLRQILRKRGGKLKADPEVRDLSLACDLLEYCASDLMKSKDFSDIVGVRVLPLANSRLSIVGKKQIYTMASTKILELLPLPAETFVHEKCSTDLSELFKTEMFQKAARVSPFGCAELSQKLGTVLPSQWRGARLVATPSGALSGSQINLQWLTQFWEYVNAEHNSQRTAAAASAAESSIGDDGGDDQPVDAQVPVVADDHWEETLTCFDSWPLIPLCNEQIGSVSCRHAVVMMPEGDKEAGLREILLKLGCLMLHPTFASTGLFRYQASESEPFVSTIVEKLGQTLGRMDSVHTDLTADEGEQMLQYLTESGVEFTDAQKTQLQRLPIFETCAGRSAQLVSLDVPGGRFIFPPSSCAGLFDPKDDSRFLKHKEQFLPLYLALGVQMLTEADVLGRFLLPTMDSADDKDRAEQIRFIRKNWDRNLSNNPQFIDQLKQVSFVAVADGRTARASELFHPEQPVFAQIFQNDPVFPAAEFQDPDWLAILEKLGLRQDIDAPLFLHCANRVHTAFSKPPGPELDTDKMLLGAKALAEHFTRHSNQLATEPDFFTNISDVRFLPVPPVGMPDELTEGEDEQPVQHHSQRTASYSEVAVPRDWALVWSARPICPAELLPPQIFWTKLKVQTPPVVEHVLDHLSALTPDVLERWAFPQSRQKAFDRIFEYLTDRLEQLPLPRLQATACIPVANTMVKPSRLFFHLSDELAPFLFEVPRHFGAYDKLFRAMGVREATDDAEALMSLLAELRQEFDGEPLNASEMRTAIRILQRLSDSVKEEQWQLSWQLSDVPLPTAISTLEPAAALFFNDAPWILERIDSSSMRATHTLLPLHLASRFGVPKLSEVVVESVDPAFEPVAVSSDDAEGWTSLLSSRDFANGVARVGGNHNVLLEGAEVCRLLSPYRVRVVKSIRTRFTHTSGRDLTKQSDGSQIFVDAAESVIYLAEWPEFVRGEELLAQAVSHALKQPTVLPLGPLLRCVDTSSIAPLLQVLHIADTAGEGRRGVAGTPVLPVDQELLQLRPLREYHHGEVVAWRDEDRVMRYATVVSWKTESAASGDGGDSSPTAAGSSAGGAAAAAGLLQRIELRVDDQESQVRALLATEVFSFRSNRGRRRGPVAADGEGRRSFGSGTAASGGDEHGLYDPEPEPEPTEAAAAGSVSPAAALASPRTTASRPVPAAEVSRAVRDLLAMLDVPVSLDQQQLLQAKLQMQEQLSEAQRELKTLRGGLTTAEEQLEKYKEAFTCQICMDRNADVALVRCGHRFCNECMGRLQASNPNQKCAYCRQEYTDTVPFFSGT
jgi:sacsin